MKTHTWVIICILVGMIAGGLLYRHFAQEVDSRGATRLMRAIEENDPEKMDKFLHAGDVNVRDKSGQTALFYAARHATDPKTVYQLIVAGADPFLADKHGRTALVAAAEFNSSVPVVMALAAQELRLPEQHQQNLNEALARAAKHNTAEVIKALLIANVRLAAGPDKQPLADFLAHNEKLSEQEKNDYRQAMLVLEILDAREQFLKNHPVAAQPQEVSQKTKEGNVKKAASAKDSAPKKEVKKASAKPLPATATKPAPAEEKPSEAISENPATTSSETAAESKPNAESKPSVPVPQEKQMDGKE